MISENLKKLIEEHNLNTLELARRTGIGQPVIYRIMTGETDNPKIATVRTLADYFGISVNQLLGENSISSFNKPEDVFTPPQIPLLSFEQVSFWPYLTNNILEKTEKVITDLSSSPHFYALKVNDNSMAPLFNKGTLLIIDGDKKPKDQDYVIILLKKQKKVVFRQLLFSDKHRYLKPLNPDNTQFKIQLFNPKTDSCKGVLIQAKINFF